MHKFEESSLVVAYIKELLHNFNLPMLDVITPDTKMYEGKVYIKGNRVVKYINGSLKTLSPYEYNKSSVNRTTNLAINSSTYDVETHRYLGNYLRFVRDYQGLDLMNMYNCFEATQPSKLIKQVKLISTKVLTLNSLESNYTYYMVPVKFDKTYTIAIDSWVPYELMCIVYTNNFLDDAMDSTTSDNLIKETYRVINGSKYTQPFLFSTSSSVNNKLWDKEKHLYLLLRLPAAIDSSITILEGVYNNCNTIDNCLASDYFYGDGDANIKYPTRVSLLEVNDKKSYPFSDRLIEYLSGMAVTELDEISANILRVQYAIYGNSKMNGYVGIWTDTLTKDLYNRIDNWDYTKGNIQKSNKLVVTNGAITTEFKKTRFFKDDYKDLTYRLDKDVETRLRMED